MNYKDKRNHPYYRQPPQRRGNSGFQFKTKITEKKELFGHNFGTTTKVFESSHVPTSIEEDKEDSFTGNVNNGVVGVGGSVTKKDSKKTEFDA